jgi:ComF family protein
LLRIIKAFAEAIFPSRCLNCGAFIRPEPQADETLCATIALTFRRAMNRFLCSACLMDFQPAQSPLCCRCGAVFAAFEGEDHLCENCIRAPMHFHQARACGIYEGALRWMIQDFKFHGKIYLAKPFGLLMLHTFHDMYTQNATDPVVPGTVVPVPLHVRRHRMRGFNQAFLLAKHLIDLIRLHPDPGVPALEIDRDILLRCRWTHPQTGLNKDRRRTNIADAFRVNAPEKAAGKHILLIDDVYTTGATVDECARILIQAGAARVDVLTLARA